MGTVVPLKISKKLIEMYPINKIKALLLFKILIQVEHRFSWVYSPEITGRLNFEFVRVTNKNVSLYFELQQRLVFSYVPWNNRRSMYCSFITAVRVLSVFNHKCNQRALWELIVKLRNATICYRLIKSFMQIPQNSSNSTL